MQSITDKVATLNIVRHSFILCLLSSLLITQLVHSERPGHMQPLASHAIKHPVKELDGFPSPQEFYTDYVYPSVPVVFKNGAKKSPGFLKWTDEYFFSHPDAGETYVDVELKKVENRSAGTQTMSFQDFVKQYKQIDAYMVYEPPQFIREDVLMPPSILCDEVLGNIFDLVMWFSSGGTKSVIHNDDADNFNCVFSGTKDILFMNITKYRNQIVFDHPEGSFMSTNVESVDFDKYPQFENMEFYHTTVTAGDCLYIPYKWVHQVNSIDRNIAVNVWYTHLTDLLPTPDSCGTHSANTTLADIKLHDKENPFDPFTVLFQFVLQHEGVNEIKFLQFIKTVDEFDNIEWTDEALVTGKGVFQLVDVDEDQQLNKDDVKLLKRDTTRQLLLEQQLMMLRDVLLEQKSKQTLETLKSLQQVKHKEEL